MGAARKLGAAKKIGRGKGRGRARQNRGRAGASARRARHLADSSADNNCLYNAASIYYAGNESLADILRLLTSIELFTHSAYYAAEIDNIWETLSEKTMFSNKLSMVKTLFRFESADKIDSLTDITKAFHQEAILFYTGSSILFDYLICTNGKNIGLK